MATQSTRERILEAAEELMLEKGFHSVGLNQILTAVNVPKGSFYHYFDSKEQFGVEILKHYMAATNNQKRAMLVEQDEEPDPVKRLFNYLDGGVVYIRKLKGAFPCLVLKLAAEVTDLNKPMRNEIEKGFKTWIGFFKTLLDEAVEKDLLRSDLDTAAHAQMIHDLWCGAVQRSVINRNEEPVKRAVDYLKERVKELAA